MAQMLTPKEIALEIGTTPKKLRKFLRSPEGVKVLKDAANPGKGSRYAIPRTSLKSLKTRFIAWDATKQATAEEAPKAPRTRKPRNSAKQDAVTESLDSDDAPELPAEGEIA